MIVFFFFQNINFTASKMHIILRNGNQIIKLEDSVKIHNETFTIYGKTAKFNKTTSNINIFNVKMLLRDSISILSDSLIYIDKKATSLFKYNVNLFLKGLNIKTEKMIFLHTLKLIKFPEYLTIIDDTSDILIKGEKAEFNTAKNQGFITDKPMIIMDKKNHITADTIFLNQKESVLSGWHNTQINSDSFLIKGDSLIYFYKADYGIINKNIHIKSNNAYMQGDSLTFFTKEKKLTAFHLKGDCKVNYQKTTNETIKASSKTISMDMNKKIVTLTGEVNGTYIFSK